MKKYDDWTPQQLANERVSHERRRVINDAVVTPGDGLSFGAREARRYVDFFASNPSTSEQDRQYLRSLLPNLHVSEDTIYTLNALGTSLLFALMELPESTIDGIRQGKLRIQQESQIIPPLAGNTRRLFQNIRMSDLVLKSATALVNTAQEARLSDNPPTTAHPAYVHIFNSLAPTGRNPWEAPTIEQIAQVRGELLNAQAALLTLQASQLSFLDLELRKEGLYIPRA